MSALEKMLGKSLDDVMKEQRASGRRSRGGDGRGGGSTSRGGNSGRNASAARGRGGSGTGQSAAAARSSLEARLAGPLTPTSPPQRGRGAGGSRGGRGGGRSSGVGGGRVGASRGAAAVTSTRGGGPRRGSASLSRGSAGGNRVQQSRRGRGGGAAQSRGGLFGTPGGGATAPGFRVPGVNSSLARQQQLLQFSGPLRRGAIRGRGGLAMRGGGLRGGRVMRNVSPRMMMSPLDNWGGPQQIMSGRGGGRLSSGSGFGGGGVSGRIQRVPQPAQRAGGGGSPMAGGQKVNRASVGIKKTPPVRARPASIGGLPEEGGGEHSSSRAVMYADSAAFRTHRKRQLQEDQPFTMSAADQKLFKKMRIVTSLDNVPDPVEAIKHGPLPKRLRTSGAAAEEESVGAGSRGGAHPLDEEGAIIEPRGTTPQGGGRRPGSGSGSSMYAAGGYEYGGVSGVRGSNQRR